MSTTENDQGLLAEPLPPMLALAVSWVCDDREKALDLAARSCALSLSGDAARTAREFGAWLRARRDRKPGDAELWIHCLWLASRPARPATSVRSVTDTAARLHDWFATGKMPRHFLSP
jgi:hypothetical protein